MQPRRDHPSFTLFGRLALAFALAAVCGAARAAAVAKAHPMTVQPATSMEQAIEDGARIFAQDSFGTQQTWVPEGAFGSHLMSCAACHTAGGVPVGITPAGQHIPSLIGAAAEFPKLKLKKNAVEYKSKQRSIYTLQRQIAHCVRAGVMGKPPAYDSPEMVDLVVYLTALSKGSVMGRQLPAAQRAVDGVAHK